ncbi:hypothetical protein BCR34DRAFT_595423 [Clohesyomyces aquaticus]|uniref:DUF6594 domain-containing protein n=1 Tax=Clohesyomyces aquaticus TaxID=1231657 RepID=A0A1Y2AAB8_9PLEO|nr:hypothetical protein BCR34DRAFT_595423 [Clohesyomyces aquaticus]
MAVPLGAFPGASHMRGDFRLRGSAQDVAKALLEHQLLFEDIAKYPQAGIFERFMPELCRVLYCNEWEVRQRDSELTEFLEELARGDRDGESEETRDELLKRTDAVSERLSVHYRLFNQARDISASPLPSPYFAPLFRTHLEVGNENAGLRAPNGETVSHYGASGAPIPETFTALCREKLNPIEHLLAYRLLEPFLGLIERRFRWLLTKFRRQKECDSGLKRKEYTEGGTISAVAKTLALMFCTLLLAAAIATLDSINSSNSHARLIVMTLFALVFSSAGSLLGKDSLPIYTLNSGFFQAMIIFVGTTNGSGQ